MKSAAFGYDIVIPAGGAIDAGYSEAIGSSCRALAPLGPEQRPVLQCVVDALRESGFARRILVAAPPAVRAAISGVDLWLPAGDSGAQNILAGLAEADPNRAALICPSDLPLLTACSVADFLNLCEPDAEIAVGLVRAEAYHTQFPGAPPSQFTALADTGPVTLGSVFLVQARDAATQAPRDGVAQLRMLLVEPAARGFGLGVALAAECERFARAAGYHRITLWTNACLLAARGIYQRRGYVLVRSDAHHSFGHAMVGETWELALE